MDKPFKGVISDWFMRSDQRVYGYLKTNPLDGGYDVITSEVKAMYRVGNTVVCETKNSYYLLA